MQLFLTPHSCWNAIFAPHRLATVSEGDDLGLGPGIHFTFGDIAMFEAVNQVRVCVCVRACILGTPMWTCRLMPPALPCIRGHVPRMGTF